MLRKDARVNDLVTTAIPWYIISSTPAPAPINWLPPRFLFAGYAETTMAEVLGTNGQTATLPLLDPKTGRKGQGTISIRLDEIEHQHDLVTLKLRAKNVRN